MSWGDISGATFVLAIVDYRRIVRNAMPFDRNVHRRSIRLPTWDYRERGAYFVTICTHERELLFEDELWREVAEDVWHAVVWVSDDPPDEFVVMPNHVHGIIWLPGTNAVGAQQPEHLTSRRHRDSGNGGSAVVAVAAPLQRHDVLRRVESGSLAAIVRTYKAATAKRLNNLRNTPSAPIWQRNYYERVIRDDRELEAMREYILDNPRKWADDPENPVNFPP
jgi:REP element-mobilizing transposase RayT